MFLIQAVDTIQLLQIFVIFTALKYTLLITPININFYRPIILM